MKQSRYSNELAKHIFSIYEISHSKLIYSQVKALCNSMFRLSKTRKIHLKMMAEKISDESKK